MMKKKMESRLVTVKEMANILHIHPGTMYRLIQQRAVPAIRVGGTYRFDAEQTLDALSRSR